MNANAKPLKLLVAVDGSPAADAAVRWAAGLAATGCDLHCVLLNVQKPVMSGEVGAISPASVVLGERALGAADILMHAAGILKGAGVPHELEERLDEPAPAVLDCAEAHACDAILIGRRGHGALRAALFGSVSAETVRRSRVPVIVVNAGIGEPAEGPLRILVAIDGSPEAMRAAAFAARLAAARPGCEINLLHVAPPLSVAGAVLGSREDVVSHWSGKAYDEALAGARGLLDRAGCAHAVHLAGDDDPGAAIRREAARLDCAIIAMGTRRLGPVAGMLLGSVAQRVVKQAQRAVAQSRNNLLTLHS